MHSCMFYSAFGSILALYVFLDLKSGVRASKKDYTTDAFNSDPPETPIEQPASSIVTPEDTDQSHVIENPFDDSHFKEQTHSTGDPYGSIRFTHDDNDVQPLDLPSTAATRQTEGYEPSIISDTQQTPLDPIIPSDMDVPASLTTPSSCLVHVPVTIHLRGTLAMRMKNCPSCGGADGFSKNNIESIGPLKVAPLDNNNAKPTVEVNSNVGLQEGEVRSLGDHQGDLQTVASYNERTSNILDYLASSDSIDFDKYMFEKDNSKQEGNLASEGKLRLMNGQNMREGETVTGTKKHVTSRVDMNGKDGKSHKKHIILDKHINLPRYLVPAEAYKKGVIVSLPRGKAVLKCVLPKGENNNAAKAPKFDLSTNALNENNLQKAIVGELQNHVKPEPAAKPKKQDESLVKGGVERFTAAELLHHFHKNDKLTGKFMKLFDKDMIVSLYRIAVNDIMSEINQVGHNSDGEVARKKMELLGSERSVLEKKFPGFQNSLDKEDDLEPLKFSKKSFVTDQKTKTGRKRSTQYIPQKTKTSRGTRRVKLVDTYRPLRTVQRSKSKMRSWSTFQRIKDDQALSFYGEIDPNKFKYDNPNCVEEMCEKQKQFINHAGRYFQSLDKLAMEPYQNFFKDRSREQPISVKFGEAGISNFISSRTKVKLGLKIQKIIDENASRRGEVINKKGSDVTSPKTMIELYGRLPRVPLKITLNPRGALAQLKKKIEIDLKPPKKGEPSSKAVATTSDKDFGILITNKLFVDEPKDRKNEERMRPANKALKRDKVQHNKKNDKLDRKKRKCRKKNTKTKEKKKKKNKNKAYRREGEKSLSEGEDFIEGDFVHEDEPADDLTDRDHLTEESCEDDKAAQEELKKIKASDIEIDDKITHENESTYEREDKSVRKVTQPSKLSIPSDSALLRTTGYDDPVKNLINASSMTEDPHHVVHLCHLGNYKEYLNHTKCLGLGQKRKMIDSERKNETKGVQNANIEQKESRSLKLLVGEPLPTTTEELISSFKAPAIDPTSLNLPHDSAIIKHPIKDDPVQKIINLSHDKNTRNNNLVTICNEFELNAENSALPCKKPEFEKDKVLDVSSVSPEIAKKDSNATKPEGNETAPVADDKHQVLNKSSEAMQDTTKEDVASVDDEALNKSSANTEITKKDKNSTDEKLSEGKKTFSVNLEAKKNLTDSVAHDESITVASLNDKSPHNKSSAGKKDKHTTNEATGIVTVKAVKAQALDGTYIDITNTTHKNVSSIDPLNKTAEQNFKNNASSSEKNYKIRMSTSEDLSKNPGKNESQLKPSVLTEIEELSNRNSIGNLKNKASNDSKPDEGYFVTVKATIKNKKDKNYDPYSDLGAEMKKSDIFTNNDTLLIARYRAAYADPYSTVGSLVSNKGKEHSSESNIENNKELMKRKGIANVIKRHLVHGRIHHVKGHKKHDIDSVPDPVALSLIKHTVTDLMKSYAEKKLSEQNELIGSKDDSSHIVSDPSVKLDEKILGEHEKSTLLSAFPQFEEELSRISPETKQRLFTMKPFKFLTALSKNVSDDPEPERKDPYADLGQVVEPKSKISPEEAKHDSSKRVTRGVKRSDIYDPYADMGTSIGLNQNEARTDKPETRTFKLESEFEKSEAKKLDKESKDEEIKKESETKKKYDTNSKEELKEEETKKKSDENKAKSTNEKDTGETKTRALKIDSTPESKSINITDEDNAEKKSETKNEEETFSSQVHELRDAVQSTIEKASNAVESEEERGMNRLMSVAMNDSFFPATSAADKNIIPSSVHTAQFVAPLETSRNEKLEADKTSSKYDAKMFHYVNQNVKGGMPETPKVFEKATANSSGDDIGLKDVDVLEEATKNKLSHLIIESASMLDDEIKSSISRSGFKNSSKIITDDENSSKKSVFEQVHPVVNVKQNFFMTNNSLSELESPVAESKDILLSTEFSKDDEDQAVKLDSSLTPNESNEKVRPKNTTNNIESDDTVALYGTKNDIKSENTKALLTKSAVEAEKDLYIIENLGKELIQTKTGNENVETLQGNTGKSITNKINSLENKKEAVWLKKNVVPAMKAQRKTSVSVMEDISLEKLSSESSVHTAHNPSGVVYNSNGYMIKQVPKDRSAHGRGLEKESPSSYKCYQINTDKIIDLMNEHYKKMGHSGNIWADPKEVGGSGESSTVKLCKKLPSAMKNIEDEHVAIKSEEKANDAVNVTTSDGKYKTQQDYMEDPYMQIGASVDTGSKKSDVLSPILLAELQKSQTQKKADLNKIADKMRTDKNFKDEVIGFIFEQLAKEERQKKEAEKAKLAAETKNEIATQDNANSTVTKPDPIARDPYAELGTSIDVPNKKSVLSRASHNERPQTRSRYDLYRDVGSTTKKDSFSKSIYKNKLIDKKKMVITDK